MRLMIFPANPYKNNGYSIAVKGDLIRLNPGSNDIVVWYEDSNETFFDFDRVILRPSQFALRRFVNVLRNYVNCEMSTQDLKSIDLNAVDEIFCGDVIFYRAIRKLFPEKPLIVRFHNCFARIKDRMELIDAKSNLKFFIQKRAFYRLEKEILQDKLVHKIFISEEDRNYYTSHFGICTDSEVWGFAPDMEKAKNNRVDCKKTCLVHFGGLQTHKIDSMRWFIREVFLPLYEEKKDIEFHLWGRGTKEFDDESNNIFGHGYYEGKELPMVDKGLFINPDRIGGGVKIKLIDYFEEGACFISTPYGYEGYEKSLIDNKHYFVIEPDKWLVFLKDYFK